MLVLMEMINMLYQLIDLVSMAYLVIIMSVDQLVELIIQAKKVLRKINKNVLSPIKVN
jgi:hypothetical protein